jgi:TolB-like protein
MPSTPVDAPAQGEPGWMAIALIAAFVLGAIGMFAIGARLVTRSPGPDVSAITVVPFSDVDSPPGIASFGPLFARQLADTVSKAPGLHLVERPHAATLIEGSVQTSGSSVRVAVWLVRASDRRALWSQHYEFAPQDAAGVQDKIVRAVASALHLQPGGAAPN